MEPRDAEARLVAEGLLAHAPEGLRTTRRWQAAAMRAAARRMALGEAGGDLRVPLAAALLDLLPEASDAEVAAMTLVLLGVEAAEAGALPAGAGQPASTVGPGSRGP